MDTLRVELGPYAFVSVPLFIVGLTSTCFLVRFQDKTKATRFLAAALAGFTLGMAAMFLTSSVVLWGGAFWPAADAFAALGMAAMIGFAYHCPPEDRSFPARLAMRLGTGATALALGYSVFYAVQILVRRSFGHPMHPAYPLLMPLTFLMALGVSVHRTIAAHNMERPERPPGGKNAGGERWQRAFAALWRPAGRARVMRNFSLALSLGLSQAVASALAMAGWLPSPLDAYAIGLSLLAMVVAIVYATWDHTTRQPSLTVKLVGLSLVTLLALLGGIGLFDVHTAGLQQVEAHAWQVEIVRRAVLTGDLADLPDSVVYVASWTAAPADEGPTEAAAVRPVYARDAGVDWPLLAEEIQGQNAGTESPPPIWNSYTGRLLASGTPAAARMRYGSHPPGSYHQYAAYTFELAATRYEVGFDLAEATGPMNRQGLTLIVVTVTSSLFILFVFPRFFHAGILAPLDRLLQGVKQANAGDLNVSVPVTHDDEIGFLTGSFNDTLASIRTEVAERRRAEGEARLLQTIVLDMAEAHDRNAALGVALRRVCEATGWIAGQAWLPSADGNGLELGPVWYCAVPGLEAFGQASARYSFPPGTGLLGRVWASRQPAWVHDVTQDPDCLRADAARSAGLRTALVVPVVDGEEAFAVLEFYAAEPREEDERGVRFVLAIAAQLGTVSQRKRAEEDARRHARVLEMIAEVGGLVTAANDLQTTLDTLARKIAEATGSDGAGIGLYDAEKEELSFRAHALYPSLIPAGEKRTRMVTRPSDSPALRQMLRDKQPIVFDDPQNDPRIRESLQVLAREVQVRSAVSYPLLFGGAMVGRLDLWSTRPRRLSGDDFRLLSTLADQTATAVQNARLFLTLEQKVVDRTRELSTLYEVSTVASKALSLDTLLSESLSRTMGALDGSGGAVFLLDESDRASGAPMLRLAASQDVEDAAQARMASVRADHGMAGWVVAHREPLLIPDVTADPRVPVAMHARGHLSMLLTPMQTEGQVLGLMGILRARGFSADEIALLGAIADQVGLAVQSDRLRKQAAVLEERQRLARDLHDSVTQSLYGLVRLAEGGRVQAAQADGGAVHRTFGLIASATRQALQEMRLFIHQLRPSVLQELGLAGALHQRLAAVEGRAGLQARLLADEDVDPPPPVAEALYQIAHEALNNAMRHADARSVTLHMRRDGEAIGLEIVDDGCGFDPARATGGMGLANMRERAAAVGGKLTVLSAPGEGTRVRVAIG